MRHFRKYMTAGVAVLALTLLTHVAANERTAQNEKASLAPNALESSSLQTTYPQRVVELFTSQGCSSCPQANKFISELAQNDDSSLVLSFGVTYWDYLGWEDTFADQHFTDRQRQYMKALKTPNIYTPQMVINGTDHSPRYEEADVQAKSFKEVGALAKLSLSSDDELVLNADLDNTHIVSVIRYTPGLQSVDVKAGENTGHTLNLRNVVEDVLVLEWKGQETRITSELEVGQAYAALFQDSQTLEIVTAVVLQ